MGKGGGGAPQPTSQSVTQTNLPEYARPYFEDLMKRGQESSQVQYQPYGGERTAGFTPLQQQGFEGIQNLGPSPLTSAGAGLTGLAAQQATQASQYQPMAPQQTYQGPQFQGMGLEYLNTQAPNLQQYQMSPAERVQGVQARGPMRVSGPQLNQYQMGPAQQVQGAQTGAAQTSYDPNLQTFQMGPAERARTGSFARPGTAEAYMSPYMQNVVDVQQREAQRQADIARTQRGAQAVGAGAFGGSRQAIMEAEAARNLATQKGDIQAQGLQSAYQQAQQAYQTDAQRQLQANLANQQAGLTVGGQNLQSALGVQQLGAQTGLQTSLANQQALQQAMMANQQTRQQAALANQQAGLTTGQQNLQALLQTQGLGAQTGMQAQLANQQALQQTSLANQQTAQQANLANQQAGLTTGQQNLQALLQTQGLGAQTGLQSQQLNQAAQLQAQQQALGQSQAANQFAQQNAQLAAQYGLAGLQAGEQSRQFGANLGMQGAGMLGQLGAQFGQLGQTAFGQQTATAQAQQQAGAAQQALSQDILNKRYEDFMQQTLYPQSQLQFYSSLLRGVPIAPQQTMYQYQAPASTANQLLSAGLGAYGVNKMFSKEGGEIKGYAEGGAVKGYAVGGNVANPQAQYEMALRMPIERLQQIVKGMPAPIEQGVALLVLNQKKQTQTAMEGEQAQAQLNQPTIKDRILGLNGLADMDIPEGGIAGEPEEVEGEEPLQAAAQGGPIRFQSRGEVPFLVSPELSQMFGFRQAKKSKEAQQLANERASAAGQPLPFPEVGYLETKPETAFQRSSTGMYTLPEENSILAPQQGIAGLTENAVVPATVAAPKTKPKAKAVPKDSDIAVGRYAQEPDAAAYGPSSVYPTATGAAQPAMSEDDLIKSYAEKAAGYMKEPREAFRSAQKASEEEARKGITALREESKGVAALRAARELSKGGRRSFESIGEALGAAGEAGMQYGKERRAAEKELRASQIDMAKAEMAFKQGDYELGARLMHKSEDLKLKAAEQAGLDAYRKEMVRLQGTELTEKERHNRATERYQMGYLGILGGKGDLQERRLDDVNKQKALLQASNETKTMGQIAMLKRLPEYKGMSDDQIRTALANKYYKMLSGEAGLGALAPSAPLNLNEFSIREKTGR